MNITQEEFRKRKLSRPPLQTLLFDIYQNMKHLEKFEDIKTRKEIEGLDIFDINNIPMPELDKAYIDYEPLYDTVDLYSVDEDYLYEEKKNNTT